MALRLSRRSLILGASGFCAAALLGGGALLRGPDKVIAEIIRRHLGPLAMPDAALASFIADARSMAADAGASARSIRVLSACYPLLNVPGVRGVLGDRLRFKVEQFERQVVTHFLLTTNYLRLANREQQEVRFEGLPAVCENPFARTGPAV